MLDQNRARELLELEERAVPFCDCGARTLPVARAGGLWLECSSLARPKTLLGRLLTFDFPIWHTRRLLMADAGMSVENASLPGGGSVDRTSGGPE